MSESKSPLLDKALLAEDSDRAIGPYYAHDCHRCLYVGGLRLGKTGKAVDIWRGGINGCNGGIPTWIIRYGDNGADYCSYPDSILNAVRGTLTGRLVALLSGAERIQWEGEVE